MTDKKVEPKISPETLLNNFLSENNLILFQDNLKDKIKLVSDGSLIISPQIIGVKYKE